MTETAGGDSKVGTELARLLRVVCQGGAVSQQLAQLGTPTSGAAAGFTAHLSPTAFESFAAIDLRPWSGEHFGEVDVALAEGIALRPADLEQVIGPLQRIPRLHGSPHTVQGIFEEPGLPAWAAIYLELDQQPDDGNARVTGITVRTEPDIEAAG